MYLTKLISFINENTIVTVKFKDVILATGFKENYIAGFRKGLFTNCKLEDKYDDGDENEIIVYKTEHGITRNFECKLFNLLKDTESFDSNDTDAKKVIEYLQKAYTIVDKVCCEFGKESHKTDITNFKGDIKNEN